MGILNNLNPFKRNKPKTPQLETPQLETPQQMYKRYEDLKKTDKQIVCKKLTYENAVDLLEKEETLIILEKVGGWSLINTDKYTLHIIRKEHDENFISRFYIIHSIKKNHRGMWIQKPMVKKEELANWPSDDLSDKNREKLIEADIKQWDWDLGDEERQSPKYFWWKSDDTKVRNYIKELIKLKNPKYKITPHMEDLIDYILYKPEKNHTGRIKYSNDLSVNVNLKMIPWDDKNMFIVTNPNDKSENTITIPYNQIDDFEDLHNVIIAQNENNEKKIYKDLFDKYFPPQPPQTSGGGKKIRNKVRTRSNRMKRKGKITRKNKITRKSKTRKNH